MRYESVLLVSYSLTHPLHGLGMIDERGTQTVDGVVYTRANSRENLAMLLVYHNKLLQRLPGGCVVLWVACHFPWFVVLRSFLSESVFLRYSEFCTYIYIVRVLDHYIYIGFGVYIYIRRSSITIREIIQKQKNKVS